jgi:hypothetical protein
MSGVGDILDHSSLRRAWLTTMPGGRHIASLRTPSPLAGRFVNTMDSLEKILEVMRTQGPAYLHTPKKDGHCHWADARA